MRKIILFIVPVLSLLFLSACTPSLTVSPAETEASAMGEQSGNEKMEVAENKNAYIPYSAEKLNELKGNKPFILFFHASWCPTCRKLDKNINENLDRLPKEAILKVNYDTENELKKEYGIRVQHTLVFYDEKGEIVKTDIGTRISEVLEFFNQ